MAEATWESGTQPSWFASGIALALAAVRIVPGARTLARRSGKFSSAIDFVSAITPAFDAAYAAALAMPMKLAALKDATLTMRPWPPIRFTAARQQRNVERRL